MADGTMAAMMVVLGFTDMSLNHCPAPSGCFGRSDTTPRLAISAGEVIERRAEASREAFFRYDLGRNYGPFGRVVGASFGEDGNVWIGVGHTYHIESGSGLYYAQFHAMPGIYFANGGFDLGGPIEFRSGVEVGVDLSDLRIGLSYDHRSNAGIYDENPGIETLQLRVSVPLK